MRFMSENGFINIYMVMLSTLMKLEDRDESTYTVAH